MKLLRLILPLAFVLLAGCITEKPGVYTAVIRLQEGVPCFTVKDSQETRKYPSVLRAINVDSPDQDLTVWSQEYFNLDMPPVIKPDQCILYAKDAPPLESHKIYAFIISAVLDKPESPDVRIYQGHFCLLPSSQEGYRLKQIAWSERDSCRKNQAN